MESIYAKHVPFSGVKGGETEFNFLLRSIVITLQRLEEKFDDQNLPTDAITRSTLSDIESTSFGEDLGRAPCIQSKEESAFSRWSKNNRTGDPITPPDSEVESPASPYSTVVSELKYRFAFVDSDDESEAESSSPSAIGTELYRQERYSPNEDQTVDLEELVKSGLGKFNDYDGSVYSTDLLSSHLAIASVGGTMTPNTLHLFKAPGNQRDNPDSYDTTQAATEHVSQPKLRGMARRALKIKRGTFSGGARLWTGAKIIIIQDLKFARGSCILIKENMRRGEEWLRETARSRKVKIQEARQMIVAKVTRTRVLFYD